MTLTTCRHREQGAKVVHADSHLRAVSRRCLVNNRFQKHYHTGMPMDIMFKWQVRLGTGGGGCWHQTRGKGKLARAKGKLAIWSSEHKSERIAPSQFVSMTSYDAILFVDHDTDLFPVEVMPSRLRARWPSHHIG